MKIAVKRLTIKELKEAKPKSIIRTGVSLYGKTYMEAMPNGHPVLFAWVVVRGDMPDWCIYFGSVKDSNERIASHGTKVYERKTIRGLVPCSDEVFRLYRY